MPKLSPGLSVRSDVIRPVLFGAIVGATTCHAGLAQAYIGPGAGLSALGIVFALIATVALAVVGFVWYPVKRMLRRKDRPHDQQRDAELARRDDPRHSTSTRS